MLELSRKLVVGFPVRGVFGAPTFAMLRNPVVCLPTFPKLSKLVFPSKLRKLVVGVPVLSVFSTAMICSGTLASVGSRKCRASWKFLVLGEASCVCRSSCRSWKRMREKDAGKG
jgi:hypothetical protein